MNEPKVNPGAGSGGGSLVAALATPPGSEIHVSGTLYHLEAAAVDIVATTPDIPDALMTSRITLIASGDEGDGVVQLRGAEGVRITAGPAMIPPTDSETTNGVEIVVAPEQMITISCGGIPGVSPTITVSSEGIIINSGAAPLTLTSLTNISISAADGVAEIDLAPEGVTITGPMVMINS
jgi:hypothetical protein